MILDRAEQKGTGKWTSQVALDLGAPVPTIAEAVFARCLSAVKDERVTAATILTGPSPPAEMLDESFIDDVCQALYASKICCYAQGFQLLQYASREHNWNLDYRRIAQLWRAGCIIRAEFLGRIMEAFQHDPDCTNLMATPFFRDALDNAQQPWRSVIIEATRRGVPIPAFSSALAYYDGYRSETLPANLLQAQRDYFGAHRFERVDKPRGQYFHHIWSAPVNEPLKDYMRVGIVHFMVWPPCMSGDGPILETVQRLASDPYFDLVEITRINDSAIRAEVHDLVKSGKIAATLGAQPVLLGANLDLNHSDSAHRARAVDAVKEVIDQASDAINSVAVLSGRVSDDHDAAMKLLIDSLLDLCAYAAPRDVNIVLETFDSSAVRQELFNRSTRDAVKVSGSRSQALSHLRTSARSQPPPAHRRIFP